MSPLALLLAVVPITFSDHGATQKTVDDVELRTLVAPETVTVFEPHLEARVGYRGLPLQPLLDAVYGPRWRDAEVLLLRCSDGYRPAVPVAKVRAHKAWLAFEHADGSPFHLKNLKQHEEADLGPLYLVWEDTKAIRAEGGTDWPYQVVAVDLASFAEAFPKTAPGPKASDAARRGFALFQRHCLACHTINGEGGARAPELNYPVNVTEYWKADMLKRWIDSPTSVRFSTTMPALEPQLPKRTQAIDDLLAYLSAMKARKLPPK